MVGNIKAEVTHNFCRSRFPDGEGEADLPCLRVGAELVEVFDGLSLERLVRVWIPSYLDSLLNLF